MKCAVFGGGGFIGSSVCDRLLREGHSLRVFERVMVNPYRKFSSEEHVEWISGDMLSDSDIGRCLGGMDVVIHLVSTTLPKSSNEDPIYDVQSNLGASLRVLQSMVKHGVKKIVFISSGGTIYGTPEYLPLDERHPTNPRVSYGITKLAIEKYLHLFADLHGIKPVILRVSNPFGAHQRVESAQGAVTAFIHRAKAGKPIEIWGDGTVTRDYLHVSDVAEAFLKALDYEGSRTVFNIGSGRGTTLNEIVAVIGGILGRTLEKTHLPSRPFDIPSNVLDVALAKKELGWSPDLTLEEGIRKTLGDIF